MTVQQQTVQQRPVQMNVQQRPVQMNVQQQTVQQRPVQMNVQQQTVQMNVQMNVQQQTVQQRPVQTIVQRLMLVPQQRLVVDHQHMPPTNVIKKRTKSYKCPYIGCEYPDLQGRNKYEIHLDKHTKREEYPIYQAYCDACHVPIYDLNHRNQHYIFESHIMNKAKLTKEYQAETTDPSHVYSNIICIRDYKKEHHYMLDKELFDKQSNI
jgi:hypothetical protein